MALKCLPEDLLTRSFDDNAVILFIFLYLKKHMLWVLFEAIDETLLMSTHNIYLDQTPANCLWRVGGYTVFTLPVCMCVRLLRFDSSGVCNKYCLLAITCFDWELKKIFPDHRIPLLNKSSDFLWFLVSFLQNIFYFSTIRVKWRVATVKRHLALHHRIDCTFSFFGTGKTLSSA